VRLPGRQRPGEESKTTKTDLAQQPGDAACNENRLKGGSVHLPDMLLPFPCIRKEYSRNSRSSGSSSGGAQRGGGGGAKLDVRGGQAPQKAARLGPPSAELLAT
jgi:hypothetical protein